MATAERRTSKGPETKIRYSTFPIRRLERGSVLVYVVWVLMLLSLFAASVGSQALFAVDLSDRFSEQLKAAYGVRAAVPYAALVLERDESPRVDALNEEWSNSPWRFRDVSLADASFRVTATGPSRDEPRYGLTDEERQVNLNTAPVEVLQRLLQYVGDLREVEATKIAQSIADWRDEDNDRRPLGAENAYYRSRGYECKNAGFENVEELLLVKGMSLELYGQVKEHVSVFGSGKVNLNTATETTLQALGISEDAVAGIRYFRLGEDDVQGTGDDRVLASVHGLEAELGAFVPIHDLAHLQQLAREKFLDVRSHDFRMVIEGTTDHPSSRVTAVCVIDREGTVKFWEQQ